MLQTPAVTVLDTFSPCVQLFVVERVGRRPLHLVGLMGMAVSALLLTVAMALLVSPPWFGPLHVARRGG